ncbi:glutamate receptor [Micractinium conductrix]|uniref:Glutamate receptor n=1 Tax=Micractinium conductrix TaxID=554055 RepID=A0A2P6VC23_9CHLO|nr:glutamate receptor [Micractinium conductrix]|eukprot:PSC71642.1 glutamate receptor [Micractinium conductrix]
MSASSAWAQALAPVEAPAAVPPGSPAIPNWPNNASRIKIWCVLVHMGSRYEIELFRKVARILRWEPDMLQWSCIEWDDMVASLKSGDGRCDVAVAGVEVEHENLASGIVFTRPTFQNGLRVLVKTGQQTSNIWAFWDAFTWQLWVAALGTCAAIALIVWGIENLYYRYSMEAFARDPLCVPTPLAPPAVALIVWGIDNLYYRYSMEAFARDPLCVPTPAEAADDAKLARDHQFQRYIFEVISRPMMNRDLTSFTVAGNTIQTAFGLLMLILFTLYLGNTAANLTVLQLSTGGISGIESLPGVATGTWTDYVDKLKARGVGAVGYAWDTAADEEAMLQALKSGQVKALVLDAGLMDYVSAIDCEVAAAFPSGFNDSSLLTKYNEALVALEDSGEDEQLLNQYVTPP